MDKYKLIEKIEDFAPPVLAEKWDCVGWNVDVLKKQDVKRVMLALTVTNDVVQQAKDKNCDLIISHHPLFFVPLEWRDINIYSAHTNLDRAVGGTTDTLVRTLGFEDCESDDFLRFVNCNISLDELIDKLKTISPNLRYVNNQNVKRVRKIAFCAGSGSEFIHAAQALGADAFVTGDLKFHTALDSEIVLFDIGHFESEILVLPVIAELLQDVEVFFAKETSPFIYS